MPCVLSEFLVKVFCWWWKSRFSLQQFSLEEREVRPGASSQFCFFYFKGVMLPPWIPAPGWSCQVWCPTEKHSAEITYCDAYQSAIEKIFCPIQSSLTTCPVCQNCLPAIFPENETQVLRLCWHTGGDLVQEQRDILGLLQSDLQMVEAQKNSTEMHKKMILNGDQPNLAHAYVF